LEGHMLEAIQRIHGTVYPLEQLDPITPVDLARELPDPQLRRQLVQGLIVMSLIDQEASQQETDLVEQFSEALEVSIPEVKDLRYLLKGEILQLRLDLARRFWLREKVRGIWNDEGIRGIYKLVRGLMGQYENAELAARYRALEQCPPGSLGRLVWEYWGKNGFALPGEKGGAPEQILFHDCAHVLIWLWNGPRGRGPSCLLQRRLSTSRPLYVHSFCVAAVSCRYSHDAHHRSQNRILRSREGDDRDATRRSDERGSQRRLGLLGCHRRAGRGTPQALQHSPGGSIQAGNSPSSQESRLRK
jgi:hypothetical protein